MKVAFLLKDFPSYTQTFILRQIAGVMEAGNPVTILAKINSGQSGTHGLIQKYCMMDNTVYLPVVPHPMHRRVFGILGQCIQAGWKKKTRRLIKALNFKRYGREAISLRLPYKSLVFNGNGNHDIIHAQFGMLGNDACNLRQIGVIAGKVVTSFRGFDTELQLKKKNNFYRHLFRQGDLFLPVCDHFKKWLIANGCPAHKIEVLYSGIDLSEFTLKIRQPLPNQPIRLLSIARLVEKKGLHYAVAAVARIIKAGINIHYTIIGDGPLRCDLERQAAELGIGNCISMPGMKAHAEVVSEIYRNHVLLAPSVTAANGDQEGIPNALKEAMATGMAVISTWHAGIPELITDQKSGFLVPERNVDALENRLRTLIEHPDVWPCMGQLGRAVVERDFNINLLNNKLVSLYQSLHNETFSNTLHLHNRR